MVHVGPHGQIRSRDLGRFLSLSALIAWVIMPLWTFFKGLQLKREDWKPHGRLRRLSLIGGTALGAFTVMCFMPVDLTIQRSGAVELASPEEVRSRVPGILEAVYVKEGDQREPGNPWRNWRSWNGAAALRHE